LQGWVHVQQSHLFLAGHIVELVIQVEQ
jgi:hypothetical protein